MRLAQQSSTTTSAQCVLAIDALHSKKPPQLLVARVQRAPECLARRLTAPARCRALPARPESGSGSQCSTARCAPRLQAAQPGRHRWIGAPAAQPLRCRRAQPTWRVHSAIQSRTRLLVPRDRCARSHGSGAPALLGHSGVFARRRAPSAPAPAMLHAELGPGQVLLGDTALHWRGVWAGMPLVARKTALQSAALSTVPQEAVRSCSRKAHCLGWASTADGLQAQSIPRCHGAATRAVRPLAGRRRGRPLLCQLIQTGRSAAALALQCC